MAAPGLISIMERAARKAAPLLRRDFGEVQHLQVSRKGPADFVSIADKRSENTIYEILKHARPDWGFLGEETGAIPGDPTKPRWIVDPLDGTSNFLHAIPHFAVSIAVEEPRPDGTGEITQALVYQPITDESFWAEKGRGAWLHDSRIRVSSRRNLNEALIATGIPFAGHGNSISGKLFSPDFNRSRRHPSFWCCRLDLAWVAAGRFDAYWESEIYPWDVAAGMLLVREAGGFVTDFRGGDKPIERREFLAANSGLHSKLHRLVATALKNI